MFSASRKPEPVAVAPEPAKPAVPEKFYSTSVPTRAGSVLSTGVSIKGSVKFSKALVIDAEVEGTINSPATLTVGTRALIRGEIRTNSAKVQATPERNTSVTDRCDPHRGCTLRG